MLMLKRIDSFFHLIKLNNQICKDPLRYIHTFISGIAGTMHYLLYLNIIIFNLFSDLESLFQDQPRNEINFKGNNPMKRRHIQF
jgi:hypothetical protein